MFSNSLENAFDRLAFDFVLFRFFDGLFVSALVCKATVCRRRPNEIVGNQIREESENGRQWSYGLQVCSDAGVGSSQSSYTCTPKIICDLYHVHYIKETIFIYIYTYICILILNIFLVFGICLLASKSARMRWSASPEEGRDVYGAIIY